MFMVDGFITGTAVDFLKFSTTMVPLQIRVGLTMNAIYIGFARERTFLTDQLDEQARQLKEKAQQEYEAGQELQKTADVLLNSMGYAVVGRSGNSDDEVGNIQKDISGTSTDVDYYEEIYKMGFENGAGYRDRWARSLNIGFITKDIKDLPTPQKFTEDHTVSFKWWFSVWASPDQVTAAKVRDARGAGYAGTLVGNYAGNGNSSKGWKSWDTLYLSHDWDSLQPDVLKKSPRLSNGGTARFKHSKDSSYSVYLNAESKYYTTKFAVEITVTANSNGNTITKSGTGEMWKVLQGTSYAYSKLKINWGAPGNRLPNTRS
jgi:hypothetical protein